MKKRIKEWFGDMTVEKWVFVIGFIVSIGLIVGGFFAPPLGLIDNSVLIAVGELMGFALIPILPQVFGGGHIKLEKGDASLTVKMDDDNQSTNDQ